MVATVQAAELGAKTICLEKNAFLGGNGLGTEDVFALGTSDQEAAGVEVPTFREIIATDAVFFNYRINSLFWKDMVENSGANYEWLKEKGAHFSGVVDNYYGLGKVDCFHWFATTKGDSLIDPLSKTAEDLGATFMTETPAIDLVMDGDAVAGVYACKDDGSIIQINAKAVILASGGYANNDEMMLARGYDMTYSINQGLPGNDGDGLRMAVSAGANDVSAARCFLRDPYIYGLDPEALEATIARYNGFCHNGLDEDFDKEPEYLAPIETAPFYIFRQDMSFWTSIGGIDTDRQMRAIDVHGEPIPGLYAVGTDGCQLYRETYTMNIPASCQGNNVNSGRTAARHICENLL